MDNATLLFHLIKLYYLIESNIHMLCYTSDTFALTLWTAQAVVSTCTETGNSMIMICAAKCNDSVDYLTMQLNRWHVLAGGGLACTDCSLITTLDRKH